MRIGTTSEYYLMFTLGKTAITFTRDSVVDLLVVGGGGGGGGETCCFCLNVDASGYDWSLFAYCYH